MAIKLQLESTSPFQGLPELVARDEGLFAAEGLDVEFVRRGENAPTKVDRSITDPDQVSSFGSHGSAEQTGGAAMFNACEWGNYRRVEDSQTGSQQVGRRAIIAFGALMVAPDSDVYTPQQMANKVTGVPYHAGTHYLALLMLEGFIPRETIKTCLAPNGSRNRLQALLDGEIDATTLTEPYITIAEKKGCRMIVAAPYHGTEVASEEMDAPTYAAFNRAVREAVKRINADKRKYLQYFIDAHKADPDVAALTVDDLNPSRLQVVDPAPIPPDELQRTYDWMHGWGMLKTIAVTDLVDDQRQLAGQNV
jgi:NitT/TauT family transport system substrate-binding protein